MKKLLVFAGTTEGRTLIRALLSGVEQWNITACVATEYGRQVLDEGEKTASDQLAALTILPGRLTEGEMEKLMETEGFHSVVDATHPYATVVTACIREACSRTGTPYLRLLRESGIGGAGEGTVFVDSPAEAARYLDQTDGPVLLTTGSKELEAFTVLDGLRQRLYARVLPMAEVVEKCAKLGLVGRQLICMQGPFSYEMNRAMLLQTKACYLVTKDSGKTGGFDEKLRAAEDLGVCPVIIGRKPEDGGKTWEQVLTELSGIETVQADRPFLRENDSGRRFDWFPLFTNIKDQNVLIVGAGKIASRRIHTLLQFSCRLTVVAREAEEAIRQAADGGGLILRQKEYETADLNCGEDGTQAALVLAATDDRQLNHRIFCECRERGITVNVSDRKEECSFYFPGVAIEGEIVAGFTAEGRNHGLVKEGAKRVREALAGLREETK